VIGVRGALPSALVSARAIAVTLAVGLCTLQGAGSVAASTSTSPITSLSENPINDQGSNYHYSSILTSVSPRVSGLSVQVLEFADRLLLTNHTDQTVTVYGYQREPYARVLANGTAEVNLRSPATYLNASFYGNITVPAIADQTAPPRWSVLDRTGQFEWHDHRIHWASPLKPPQVTDAGKRTLIFDWSVPIAVGPRAGTIDGQLFWTPESSNAPTGAIVAGVLIVLGGLLFVWFVRKRRRGEAAPAAGEGRGQTEAW